METIINRMQNTYSKSGLVLDISCQKLQETGRDIIRDKSRHMNHGMCMNETNIIQTKEGIYALSLDGVNDCVEFPDNASLKPTKVVTMEFWANPSSYSDLTFSRCLGFAVQCGYSFWQWANNGMPWCWTVELNRIGNTRRYMDILINTNQIPLNTYTHIVTIFDTENGKITVYKNGAFFQNRGILTGDIVYSGNFLIGDKFKGIFDELRIYNRALSVEEVRGNMFTSKRYRYMRGV